MSKSKKDPEVNDPRVKRIIEERQLRAVDGTEIGFSEIIVRPDEALVDSIDTVLTKALGMRTREAVFDYLARERSLAREDVPRHLGEFCAALEECLGEVAKPLEEGIVRRLYRTLNWQFIDIPNFGLIEHAAIIRGIIERTERKFSIQ